MSVEQLAEPVSPSISTVEVRKNKVPSLYDVGGAQWLAGELKAVRLLTV